MKGFYGQELKYNDNFRYLSPNEHAEAGTLVWIERFKDAYYNVEVVGPFVIQEGWGPQWFGDKNEIKGASKKRVSIGCTHTGRTYRVTHANFLNECYYVINEEKVCIDVETK